MVNLTFRQSGALAVLTLAGEFTHLHDDELRVCLRRALQRSEGGTS